MKEYFNYKDSEEYLDCTTPNNPPTSKIKIALGSIYITEPFILSFQSGGKYIQIPFNAFLPESNDVTINLPTITIAQEGIYEIQLNMIVLFPSIDEITLLALFAGPLNGTISINGSPITEGTFFFGQLCAKSLIRLPFLKSVITKLNTGDRIEILVTNFVAEEIIIEKSTLSVVQLS
ncbi:MULTISPECIES: hypothetical protein [unclassified Clostridium]|uniref:hypothetical protein n=1 Tax=unclassified Clostridium TaxID=2614128 RepID=UPI0025C5A5CC|nr:MULTISPECIES: hypothetical protein [unclassified Clostridium]